MSRILAKKKYTHRKVPKLVGANYRAELPTQKYRVLLTGISGSIGCHVFAHIMHNTDWHVVGVASFRHKGWSDRITHMFIEHPDWQKRLTMITHDIAAPFSPLTIKKIGQIDYVINLAAYSDVYDSIQNPVQTIRNNVDVAVNMLEYAREAKPKAFIQFSTDEVYGPTDGVEVYKEWAPIVPSNPYAASKACQEAIAISYWRTYGVPVVITNTMNNFGEMQQPSKFPVIVQKAVESGERLTIHGEEGNMGSRSYIHSRNVADALLFILQQPVYMHTPDTVDKPDRYNIAGDRQLSNLELAKLVADYVGKPLHYELESSQFTRPGHDKHYGLDDTKLKDMGWKSPVPFEQSLKNTVEWQKEHKEWLEV